MADNYKELQNINLIAPDQITEKKRPQLMVSLSEYYWRQWREWVNAIENAKHVYSTKGKQTAQIDAETINEIQFLKDG